MRLTPKQRSQWRASRLDDAVCHARLYTDQRVSVDTQALRALLIEHARLTAAVEAADALATAWEDSGELDGGLDADKVDAALADYRKARRSRAVPRGLR